MVGDPKGNWFLIKWFCVNLLYHSPLALHFTGFSRFLLRLMRFLLQSFWFKSDKHSQKQINNKRQWHLNVTSPLFFGFIFDKKQHAGVGNFFGSKNRSQKLFLEAWNCQNMVIILTSETLSHYSCAAEIASAYYGGTTKIILVSCHLEFGWWKVVVGKS